MIAEGRDAGKLGGGADGSCLIRAYRVSFALLPSFARIVFIPRQGVISTLARAHNNSVVVGTRRTRRSLLVLGFSTCHVII